MRRDGLLKLLVRASLRETQRLDLNEEDREQDDAWNPDGRVRAWPSSFVWPRSRYGMLGEVIIGLGFH